MSGQPVSAAALAGVALCRPHIQTSGVVTQSGRKRYSGSDVLPQSDVRRNGEIGKPGRHCDRASALTWYAGWLILLLYLPIANAAAGATLDWSYHSNLRQPDVESTPAQAGSSPPPSFTPSPVVLPPANWPEHGDTDPRGWHLKQPSIGTGRVEAYTDSRTAVRLAEQRQDSALASSGTPLPGFDELPGALQGLNYRIDFGVEYRF